MKYDTNGNELWAQSAGGNVADWALGIAVDISGNSFITGGFGGPYGSEPTPPCSLI